MIFGRSSGVGSIGSYVEFVECTNIYLIILVYLALRDVMF